MHACIPLNRNRRCLGRCEMVPIVSTIQLMMMAHANPTTPHLRRVSDEPRFSGNARTGESQLKHHGVAVHGPKRGADAGVHHTVHSGLPSKSGGKGIRSGSSKRLAIMDWSPMIWIARCRTKHHTKGRVVMAEFNERMLTVRGTNTSLRATLARRA